MEISASCFDRVYFLAVGGFGTVAPTQVYKRDESGILRFKHYCLLFCGMLACFTGFIGDIAYSPTSKNR